MIARGRSPTATLIAQLPPVRGQLIANAPVGRQTWFGTGGSAEVVFRPADAIDLAEFLAALAPGIAATVIGIGSNILVRDGGIPGVTVRLGRGLASRPFDWRFSRGIDIRDKDDVGIVEAGAESIEKVMQAREAVGLNHSDQVALDNRARRL